MSNLRLKLALSGASFLAFLLSANAIGFWPKNFSANIWESFTANLSDRALAETFASYTPPVGRDRIQRTEGAGSRGCPAGSFGSIALLIPSDHVGLTATGRPTFSWYVSSLPSTPMQFALVEPGVAQPLMVKQFQSVKSGIVQLEIPPEMPELSVGKLYRWTVSLVCNNKRPSENIYVRSWISRVASPIATNTENPALTASAQMLRDNAAVYARSGIWYDAVANVSKAYLADPKDDLNYQYLRFLLNGVGLSQVPISQPQPLIADR